MSSVDHLTWLSAVGHGYISDDKYTLAHLFEKEQDVFGYLYDFGDKWFHEIAVERIIPVEESTGRVEILEGKGMCPGENMKGSWCYQDDMRDYDNVDTLGRFEKSVEILQQANYKDFGKPLLQFDPERFDMEYATRCLKDALASHNSVRQGAKGFKMPMSGTPDEIDAMDGIRLKKGQTFKRTSTDSFGYWQEAQTCRKDKKWQTICAECGKPGVDLKACGTAPSITRESIGSRCTNASVAKLSRKNSSDSSFRPQYLRGIT
ncbi:hypothetical protein AURDEDRAFT_169617 [Auricularia subglabra TFB-10046 SS5]|uniref:Plasmid pRiA4b Orf3-like domain-containing protein n=1 Tax=Auricularia subglabra (strain TFB-10046 / SS5) TaxID=717982 RepID=J0WXI0_AURST|nr:hypothetical protein AURDEDRAFT_169617 [Auricularia subglabra TFB-10046 SS5]